LPGLVRANAAAAGPYESAGDPAVVAGPNGTFWYANIAFDRTDAANGVAVSRSANGGKTWSTHFVVQTPANQGAAVFNDKDWIGADPSDPTGKTAYVTWTLFKGNSSAIVISKTTKGRPASNSGMRAGPHHQPWPAQNAARPSGQGHNPAFCTPGNSTTHVADAGK
jgi:hypothetical protein